MNYNYIQQTARRGIVQKAKFRSAEKSIMNTVVEGCLLVAIALGCTIWTAALLSTEVSGGGAVGLFALMSWLAVGSDEGTTYFISWLADDANIVYD